MDVATFYSGTEILRGLDQRPADCVVLDVQLPDFKALDLFDRIHLAHPDLPLIVMTAWEDDELRSRALAGGAAGFFYKPFGDDEFLGALQTALAGVHSPARDRDKPGPGLPGERIP